MAMSLWPKSRARRWLLATFLLITTGVLLTGCARTAFYLQAARGQLELVTKRVPVARALADESVDEDKRRRLRLAYEARQFAASDLGLPDNKSYTSYVQLDRPYVLWNVIAAPEFSVNAKTWCFPFAGCVSYRGYFREKSARKETEKLREDGLDVFYGGVGAYSTLGKFADPILSTMLSGDEVSTIAVIFHELAHQVVYRPSDSIFSESFASFVELEGVRRYLATREGAGDFTRFTDNLARRKDFAALVAGARETLAQIYARDIDDERKRALKQKAMDQLRADYAVQKEAWGGYAGYDGWFSRDLNNAHLASVGTYSQWVPAFGVWLEELDGDLPAFYAAVETLAKQDDAVVQARLESLASRAP